MGLGPARHARMQPTGIIPIVVDLAGEARLADRAIVSECTWNPGEKKGGGKKQ